MCKLDFEHLFIKNSYQPRYDFFINEFMTCQNHKSIVRIYQPKISTGSLAMTRCQCGQFEAKNDCNVFKKKKPFSDNN